MRSALSLLERIEEGYRWYHSEGMSLSEQHPKRVQLEADTFRHRVRPSALFESHSDS